jgi:hypothetical protein
MGLTTAASLTLAGVSVGAACEIFPELRDTRQSVQLLYG